MTVGLSLTFESLATSRNEAATAVLRQAMEHRDREIADAAFRALLRRNSADSLRDLIARWHTLSARWKTIALERPEVFHQAIQEGLGSSDEQLLRNATDATINLHEYDFVGQLLNFIEQSPPGQSRTVAMAVLRLAELLYEELHGRRDYRVRRDPQRVRQHVVGSLERGVERFVYHRSREVVEAYLLLTPLSNASLWHILQDEQDLSHGAVTEQLLRSTRLGVERLLLSFLDHPRAPIATLRTIGRRCDVGFFRHFCRKLSDDANPLVDTNLGRIDTLPWIESNLNLMDSLIGAEQAGVVRLIAKARLTHEQVLPLLLRMVRTGEPLGRQAATRALADRLGEVAQPILAQLINDQCPLVQAEAARHLRPCSMPNALIQLIALLEHPHPLVRESAQHSLREFSFERYLQVFDRLSPETRVASGNLVKRVNPHAIEELRHEALERGRARRLRAMEMADVLEFVPQMEAALLEFCQDEDHIVRGEAARRLPVCGSRAARERLRELLTDPSSAVQLIAEQALQEMVPVEEALFSETPS